jgi:hypothetical protein
VFETTGKFRTAETASVAAQVNERTTFTVQSACPRTRGPLRPFRRHAEEHPARHFLGVVSSLAVSRAGLDRFRSAQPQPSKVSTTRRRSSIFCNHLEGGAHRERRLLARDGSFSLRSACRRQGANCERHGTRPLRARGDAPKGAPAAPADDFRLSLCAAAQRPTRRSPGHPFVAGCDDGALERCAATSYPT